MKVNREQNLVQYAGEDHDLNELLARLAGKDSGTSARYLAQNASLPRGLRTDALRFVLNDYVKIAKELVLSDEVRYRLNWYPKFSETQLVLFWKELANNNSDRFNEKEEVLRLKKTFYLLLLMNADNVGFDDEQIPHMLTFHEDNAESFDEFMDEMNPAFYDFSYNLDGVAYEDVHTVLKKGSTVADIRKLAKKYDVDVPKRLKKEEFVALVCDGLRRQGKYSEEQEEQLRKMNAISLTRFAKLNGIKASTEMKKDDVIDYLMNHLEASSNVQKERIELITLPELEEFVFSPEFLGDVKFNDEEDEEQPVVQPEVQEQEEQPEPQPEPEQEQQPEEEAKEEQPQEEVYSDEVIAQVKRILDERDRKDIVEDVIEDERYKQVVKMMEDRIQYLEGAIDALRNNPIPVNITVNAPEQAPKAEEVAPEAEEEFVVAEELVELNPTVVDAEFGRMTDKEKKKAAKVLMADASSPLIIPGDPDSVEILSKKKKKQSKKARKLEKIREANERAMYRRNRRRGFWKAVKVLILILILLFILLSVWFALYDKGIIAQNTATEKIDEIISYIPIFKTGEGYRGWLLKSIDDVTNLVKGLFNK